MNLITPAEDEIIFTVSELNLNIKNYLESNYFNIWVSGEISNFSSPSSGHFYFVLKDNSQIRCAFFKKKQRFLNIKPFDGMQVLVRGTLSLYTERGDYQLIIDQLLLQGEGALKKQFELLKKKLEAQGLFDLKNKKPIPKNIKTLGIITSGTGAALQDVLSVLKRRWPLINILVYDSQVQGEQAPGQLIKSIIQANQDNCCECLLLTRGGGSLEDLWAFNDENLALAIFNSVLPIVSAVGHEIDFSISDYVADLRAATPSAAAELLSPDGEGMLREIKLKLARAEQLIFSKFNYSKQNLLNLNQRCRLPINQIDFLRSKINFLTQKLSPLVFNNLQNAKNSREKNFLKLRNLDPRIILLTQQEKLKNLNKNLEAEILKILNLKQRLFEHSFNSLDKLGPMNILRRGYAIAQDENNHVLTQASEDLLGQEIKIQLEKGILRCLVTASFNKDFTQN